ncbi:aminopeptidase [Candidatus Woesearchaeota archaeon]|nr:aminopeptidase [Candidatus Woesearchaeota archaeon]
MLSQKNITNIVSLLNLKGNEKILIIEDSTSQFLTKPLYSFLRANHKINVKDLDDYERPLAKIPVDLKRLILESDVCFYAIDKKGNSDVNEVTFRKEIMHLVEKTKVRVSNMLSVTEEIIESGFNYDILELKKFTLQVYDYLKTVDELKVTTPQGTNLIVNFDSRFRWIASTGFAEEGFVRNAMPSEVYTYPANINGVAVVTGTYGYLTSLNEFKDSKKTLKRLNNTPLFWTIENGKIVDVKCDDKELEKLSHDIINSCENGNKIGEFALGTNLGISQCLGSMMLDEKFPTVHIAHGHGYSNVTGADYDSNIHFDGLLLNATVENTKTGVKILENGKFLI